MLAELLNVERVPAGPPQGDLHSFCLVPHALLESRLDEHHISDHLYTRHMPDPDLVIRTSGEQRISNFLLWQIAYSEIFITDRLWPDFRGIHLLEAIQNYQKRERRFGGLGETFTDEDLDTLEPAAEVAEEIVTELTPKQLAGVRTPF